MPRENRNRKFFRAALCAAFGIVLVVAGGSVVFGGDDEDDDWADTKFIKGLMRGIGLRNGQEAGIEYKERPPRTKKNVLLHERRRQSASLMTLTKPGIHSSRANWWPAGPTSRR